MKGFKNVNAYIYGKGVIKTNIGIENGFIKYIGDNENNIEEICKIDGILVPGFIDEHIHGVGGSDTMDATKEALVNISTSLVKEGTTAFLATTMTQENNLILSALENIGKFINTNLGGATLLGVHLEGPFISKKYKGAQPENFIQNPYIKTMEEYIKVSRETIKMVTFAPEKDENNTLLKYLNSNNIITSIGHSNASYSEVKNALNNGLKCVTHTFNAQSPIHHRDIGVAGSAMLFDNLSTEIIADIIHISLPALKLLIKNKPKDRIILITDSIRAKWEDTLISELGGQKVFISNGKAILKDGTIAGSILKMNTAIKNLVTLLNIPLEDAIDFATYNPAKNINVLDKMGTIDVGKLANFTVLDKDFNITLTMVNGNIVYKK